MQSETNSRSCSLTIDVEEYFQVEAFANDIDAKDWKSYPSRVELQIELLLDLLEKHEVSATFFVLGFIAVNHPKLVQKIAAKGHEIASHGFNHRHITKQTRDEFSADIIQSKELLEQLISAPVLGYRAPCFSITAENQWAHEEIYNAGYLYSSSTYPISHDFYGVPKAPKTPYLLTNGLLEIPISTVNIFNKTFPAGGGGYFRLLPFIIFKKMFKASEQQLNFLNFYTHPWEYDPNQPRIKSSLKSNFRHHVNQHSTLNKLDKLCKMALFDTLANCHLNRDYPCLGDWNTVAMGDF